MPETGKALAKRLGLPWRPDLMSGKHEAAKRYQDAITEAAAREAWEAGSGDPSVAAMYYHGGSNRSIWGPKTRAYANSILARLGN